MASYALAQSFDTQDINQIVGVVEVSMLQDLTFNDRYYHRSINNYNGINYQVDVYNTPPYNRNTQYYKIYFTTDNYEYSLNPNTGNFFYNDILPKTKWVSSTSTPP